MRSEPKHPGPSRNVRASRGPSVSVVVASQQPRAALDRVLSAIVAQCSGSGAELVIVRGGAVPPAVVARKSASNVKFVPAPPDATAAEMRALGASAAGGDVVLFLDEEEAAADPSLPGRLRAMISGAHAGGAATRVVDAERAAAIRAYLSVGAPPEHAADRAVGGILPSAGVNLSSLTV